MEKQNNISTWILCRFADDSNNEGDKAKQAVHSVLYGQFSLSDVPPKKRWVFLATDAGIKIQRGDHHGSAVDYEEDLISSDELQRAKSDKIKIIMGSLEDKSIRAGNYECPDIFQSSKTSLNIWRYFVVRRSSIREVNGRYIYIGQHCGASMYQNVRGWCLLRQPMDEIPELGIQASNSYQTDSGLDVAESYHTTAAAAVEDLLSRNSKIKDGSHSFKRRFIEISRAGNRLVSVDQSLLLHHNEMQRAAIRNNFSETLLLKLHQAKIQDEEQEQEPPSDSESDPSADDSDQDSQSDGYRAVKFEEGMSDTRSHISSFPTQSEDMENGNLTSSRLELYNVDTELALIVGKKVTYQAGSQGFKFYLPPEEKKSTIHNELHPDRSPVSPSPEYFSAASEMSADVLKHIEIRETILLKMKLEADRLNTLYLESDHNSPFSDLSIIFRPLFELIKDMRFATIDLSNSVGTWARILHKEKMFLAKKQKKQNLFDSANDPRRYRKYCVLIAQKSAHDLYPASKELVSTSKRLSRGQEPPKIGIENKLVGIFDTRDEAEKAFEEAFVAIPQEYLLLEDKLAVSKSIVGLRPCGKHYLVRSNGVAHDVKCEQCALEIDFKNSKEIIPHVYPEDILAQFIWKGENYMDKVWKDLDFMDGIFLLKNVFPDEEFSGNPLLLSNERIARVMESVKVIGKGNGNDSMAKDPLTRLRGEHEKLRDAIFAGKRENGNIAERKFQSLYKHSPYKRNLLHDLPPEMLVEKKITTKLNESGKIKKGKSKTLSSSMSSVRLASLPSTARSEAKDKSPAGLSGTGIGDPKNRSSSSSSSNNLFSTSLPPVGLGTGTLLSSATLQAIHDSSSSRPLPSITYSALAGGSSSIDLTSSNQYSSRSRIPSPSTIRNRISGDQLRTELFSNDEIEDGKLPQCLFIIGQSTAEIERFRGRMTAEQARRPTNSTESAIQTASATSLSTTAAALRSANLSETPASTPPSSNNALSATFPSMNLTSTVRTPKPSQPITSASNGMNMVETFYTYRGAQFSTTQLRQPVAHRVDDVFCRLDVGEFASFSKGRAIRSFYFQEEQARKGKEKIEERKRMQQLIKAAIEVDIIDTDIPYIRKLIEDAKRLQGSVLNLDIILAESHIKYYFSLIKYSIQVQAQYRGCRSRSRVRAIRAAIALRKKLRLLTEKYAVEMAPMIVKNILDACVKKEVKSYRKTVFKIAVNFSGQFSIVLVSKLVRTSRKPVELCNSCQTKSLVDIFQPVEKSFKRDRAPCTCRRVQCPERWLLKVYDPLDCIVIEKTVAISEVKETLRKIKNAQRLLTQMHVKNSLIGESFGNLNSLFTFLTNDGKSRDSSQEMNVSLAAAALRAREESSVLPLLPKHLSKDLRQKVDKSKPDKYSYIHWLETTPSTKTIVDFCGPVVQDSEDRNILWEPFSDMNKSTFYKSLLKERANEMFNHLEACMQRMQTCQEISRVHSADAELKEFACEDARSLVLKTLYEIDMADKRIARAMLLSKELIHDFSLEEANLREEWKQSYDELENADDWKGLNCKRKLEKILEKQLAEFHSVQELFKPIYDARVAADNDRQSAERAYSAAIIMFEACLKEVAPAGAAQIGLKAIAHEAVSTMLSTFNMPFKRKTPQRRRLQIVPYSLVFVRDPFERVRRQFRGAFVLLDQRVMGLRPDVRRTLDRRLRSVVRCIVQVLTDPVSGYYIVHVGQDELPVEESTQHLDFGLDKQDFSDLTSHALENDIVLRPADVQTILALDTRRKSRDSLSKIDSKSKLSSSPSTQFVLPSKRNRSLKGVRVLPIATEKYKHLETTFQLRRSAQEKKDVAVAQRLMDLLKLQPHTGRPCLGLLHFQRRIRYSLKQICSCLWYSDLLQSTPMSESNIVSSRFDMISKQRMMVTLYASLKQFEIVMRSASITNEFILQLEISTQRVLDSLRAHPLQLSIFAVELITNCFSFDTSHYIHRHIDLSVPGFLNRKYWRHYLTDEVPFPSFFGKKSSLYRGTIYNCYRFISGFYFYVQIYRNADGDIKIELKKPHDGKFRLNKYDGETICCEIDRDTVRAFIAKVSVFSSLVGEKYLSNLTLLHEDNLMDLLTTILDTVHVNIHFDRSIATEKGEEDEEDVGERAVAIPLTVDGKLNYIRVNVQKLQEKIQKIFVNYNYWIANNRARDNCSSLKSDNIIMLHRWVADLVDIAPQWKIKTEKDVNNRQVVPIYTALSPPFIDLEKFATSKRSQLSEDNWMKVQMDGSITYSEEIHISKFHTHMDVTLRTNTDKSMIYVEMSEANVNNQVLQTIFELEECKLMGVEDSSSHHLRNFIKKKSTIIHRVNEFHACTKKSLPQVSKLNELLKKEKILSGRVDRAIAKVRAVVDLVFEKSARKTLNATQSNLSIEHIKSSSVLTAPDSDASPPPVHKFSSWDGMFPTPQKGSTHKGSVSKKRSTLRYQAFIAPAEREASILLRWTDSIVKYLNEFARDSGEIIVSGAEIVKKKEARSSQSLWNTPLWRELPYSTSTIPKHSHPVSNQIFYSQKVENPTGFRSPKHWHRERFQRVYHINKQSNFKVSTLEQHHQGKRVNNEHLVTIADRKFLLRDQRVFENGVSSFSLFEFGSCYSYQISGADYKTTYLYRSCFASEESSSGEYSSGTHSKPKDSIRNVLASNFVFKVIVSGYLNAAAAVIKEMHKVDFMKSSLSLSSLFDSIDESRLLASNAIQGSATDVTIKAYDPPQMGRKFPRHLHTPHQNTEVLGIYIPQDQSLGVKVIKVNSTDWMSECTRYLRIEDNADKISRGMALLGLIYHAKAPFGSFASGGDSHNKRVQYLIEKFYDNIGWREGNEQMKLLEVMRRDEERMLELQAAENIQSNLQYRETSVYVGDVCIMLRHGTRDLQLVTSLLDEMDREYAPVKALRLLKEGKERQWREGNHTKYKTFIYQIAALFLPGMEALYSHRKPCLSITNPSRSSSALLSDSANILSNTTWMNSRHVVRLLESPYTSLLEARALVTKFQALLRSEGKRKTSGAMIYRFQKALMLDTDEVYCSEVDLLRFDFVQSEEFYCQCVDMLFQKYLRDKEETVQRMDLLAVDRQKLSSEDDATTAEDIVVDVTVGQVVYAVFKLHCSCCVLPLNICKFPGCSLIRGQCRAIENTEEHVIGSGLHPIEQEIRKFLFSGNKMIFDYFPMVPFHMDYSSVEEIALEAEEDRVEKQIHESDQSAAFTWQEISAEVHHLRHIAHLLLMPEIRDGVTALDVMRARGGLQQGDLENYINHVKNSQDNTGNGNMIMITSEQSISDDTMDIPSAPGKRYLCRSDSSTSPHRRSSSKAKRNLTSRMSSRASFMASMAAKKSTIASLPLLAVRDAVDVCIDGAREKMMKSVDIVDPYPATKYFSKMEDVESKHPLPSFLFTWLMRKVSIIRPNWMPPNMIGADVDTAVKNSPSPHHTNEIALRLNTQSSSHGKTKRITAKNSAEIFTKSGDDLTLGFDRFHCEHVLQLKTGSGSKEFLSGYLVIVTVLQGILEGASFVSDERGGVPECAYRHCPADKLSLLRPGLTILVYDYHSKVSRATALNEKAMYRVANFFQCSPDNCPYIAAKIVENAETCLILSRVAGFFTGVSFNGAIMAKAKADKEAMNKQKTKIPNQPEHTNEIRVGDKYAIYRNDISRRLRHINAFVRCMDS